jgi:hypothetical protein
VQIQLKSSNCLWQYLKKLERHGQAWPEHDLSTGISAYPELFAIVGGNVPDYRGLFLRGHGSQVHAQNNGSMVGVTATTHSSGALGAVQGDAIRNITGTTGQYDISRHNSSGAFYSASTVGGGSDSGKTGVINGFDTSRMLPVDNEIRPANMAVRYFIRALP